MDSWPGGEGTRATLLAAALDQHPRRLLLYSPRSARLAVPGRDLQTGKGPGALPRQATRTVWKLEPAPACLFAAQRGIHGPRKDQLQRQPAGVQQSRIEHGNRAMVLMARRPVQSDAHIY